MRSRSTNAFYQRTLILALAVALAGFSFLGNTANVQASACLQLSSDLGYGMLDRGSSASDSVYLLQQYLQGLGYLAATPTGYFGPSTLYAVETFQTINGIQSTGYVGSITRAAIVQRTCPVTQSSTTANIATVVNQQSQNTTSGGVTSPQVGTVLSMGSSYVIHWNTPPLGVFNAVLEQPGGAGAGFIAQGLSNTSNQYIWQVGNVFSSQAQTSQSVATGTYRIRLENPATGSASSDEVSGWFTIASAQLSIKSIIPSSAFADNYTSAVLYGSGFTNSTAVYFDSNYSSMRATNAFVSADGTVLVFTVPTTISAGTHQLFINNGYNSTPVTVSFAVNSGN